MSDFFFVMPSFMRGAARAIDLGGTLSQGSYLLSDTPAEADQRALAGVWDAVDGDLAVAATRLIDEQEQEEDERR